MEKDRSPILHYFGTVIEEDRTVHFFKLIGKEENIEDIALMKAIELDGEHMIIKNESKNTIKVVISCLTDNWEKQILHPVITQNIKGLLNAE